MPKDPNLPLVYSCSGCSSAAQAANHIALQLDRKGKAEMSCIAGVGGDVPSLVRTATSGRPVIALDGCALACARHCLERHGVQPDHYYQLQEHGVKKRYHADFDAAQAQAVLEKISADIAAPAMAAGPTDPAPANSAAAVQNDLAPVNPAAA